MHRKVELYAMDRSWQELADLKKFKVSAAPHGGPLGKKNLNEISIRAVIFFGRGVPIFKKLASIKLQPPYFSNKRLI